MKTINSQGIILSRTNYAEADRILTILTPKYGKLRLIAKGVRKVKSKLAGGIELFSVSEISYINGKREIGTLVSARLKTNYATIVRDIERVQLGYELMRMLNRVTEDHPEELYFNILNSSFMALDNQEISRQLIYLWFMAQLLKANGHSPNLSSDSSGQKLIETGHYSFDFDRMNFNAQIDGIYNARHIKLLRLLFGDYDIQKINNINNVEQYTDELKELMLAMSREHLPQLNNLR